MGDELITSGFLHKKGEYVGGWKKRWFVLLKKPDHSGVVAYYRKQTDEKPAGEIPLDQSTLAYCNTESEKAFAFNIQKKNRTYELYASSKLEMEEWIEKLMKAALGIFEKETARPRVNSTLSDPNAWLKFKALGMICECCWEQVPQKLKEVENVEFVRIDAGSEVVSVKRKKGTDPFKIVDAVTVTLEDTFGYIVTFISE